MCFFVASLIYETAFIFITSIEVTKFFGLIFSKRTISNKSLNEANFLSSRILTSVVFSHRSLQLTMTGIQKIIISCHGVLPVELSGSRAKPPDEPVIRQKPQLILTIGFRGWLLAFNTFLKSNDGKLVTAWYTTTNCVATSIIK